MRGVWSHRPAGSSTSTLFRWGKVLARLNRILIASPSPIAIGVRVRSPCRRARHSKPTCMEFYFSICSCIFVRSSYVIQIVAVEYVSRASRPCLYNPPRKGNTVRGEGGSLDARSSICTGGASVRTGRASRSELSNNFAALRPSLSSRIKA